MSNFRCDSIRGGWRGLCCHPSQLVSDLFQLLPGCYEIKTSGKVLLPFCHSSVLKVACCVDGKVVHQSEGCARSPPPATVQL